MKTNDMRHLTTRIRFYSDSPIQRWTREEGTTPSGLPIIKCIQSEYEYREYNLNDELVGWGTEDFSAERLKTDMIRGYVYGWNGSYNKGGYRRWTCLGFYRVRKSDRKNLIELVLSQNTNPNVTYLKGEFRRVL